MSHALTIFQPSDHNHIWLEQEDWFSVSVVFQEFKQALSSVFTRKWKFQENIHQEVNFSLPPTDSSIIRWRFPELIAFLQSAVARNEAAARRLASSLWATNSFPVHSFGQQHSSSCLFRWTISRLVVLGQQILLIHLGNPPACPFIWATSSPFRPFIWKFICASVLCTIWAVCCGGGRHFGERCVKAVDGGGGHRWPQDTHVQSLEKCLDTPESRYVLFVWPYSYVWLGGN